MDQRDDITPAMIAVGAGLALYILRHHANARPDQVHRHQADGDRDEPRSRHPGAHVDRHARPVGLAGRARQDREEGR